MKYYIECAINRENRWRVRERKPWRTKRTLIGEFSSEREAEEFLDSFKPEPPIKWVDPNYSELGYEIDPGVKLLVMVGIFLMSLTFVLLVTNPNPNYRYKARQQFRVEFECAGDLEVSEITELTYIVSGCGNSTTITLEEEE